MALSLDLAVGSLHLPDNRIPGWPSDGTLQASYAHPYFERIVADLATRGICAYNDNDDGILVENAAGELEGYHILNFGGGRFGQANETYKGSLKRADASPTPPTPPPPSASCPLPILPSTLFVVDVVVQGTAFGRASNATFSYCQDGDGVDFFHNPPPGYTSTCRTRCCTLGVDHGPMGLACEQVLIGRPNWYVETPSGRAPWPYLTLGDGSVPNPFLAVPGGGSEYACPEHPGVVVHKGPGFSGPAVDCR